MKGLLAIVATLAVAAVIIFVWGVLREDRSGDPRPDAPETVKDESAERRGRDGGPSMADLASGHPDWVAGKGIPSPSKTGRVDGLPDVISELEVLTLGRDRVTANNLEVKKRLAQLMVLLDEMSDEEKQKLADYYAASENLALKYHLTIVFRNRSGDPFVGPVADFYQHEPDLVGEALGYMLGRSENVAEAFERLYDNEIDPVSRGNLLARAAFIGSKRAEKLLIKAFDEGTPTDRRVAAAGLARMHTEDARRRLDDLINGPFEKAVYDVSSPEPERESYNDLRAIAVASVLATGVAEDRERLVARLSSHDEDDAIADYVDDLMVAVPTPDFVPEVIDLALKDGTISVGRINYVCARATTEQLDYLRRLRQLQGLEDHMYRALDNAIAALK